MQPVSVMSFRNRLNRLGYTLVSIRKAKNMIDKDTYIVKAMDPLFGMICERYMTLGDMCVWK